MTTNKAPAHVLVQIGRWTKLAVSPDVASKLITLLAGVKLVEVEWDGDSRYLVETNGEITMTLSTTEILSRSIYEAIKEAKAVEKAEKEAAIAAP